MAGVLSAGFALECPRSFNVKNKASNNNKKAQMPRHFVRRSWFQHVWVGCLDSCAPGHSQGTPTSLQYAHRLGNHCPKWKGCGSTLQSRVGAYSAAKYQFLYLKSGLQLFVLLKKMYLCLFYSETYCYILYSLSDTVVFPERCALFPCSFVCTLAPTGIRTLHPRLSRTGPGGLWDHFRFRQLLISARSWIHIARV